MTELFLGLGSNLGDRAAQIERAVDLIGKMPVTEVRGRSSLIETAAEGGAGQPAYLNCVLKARSGLAAPMLLDLTQAIERQMGRQSKGDGAARLIDIDLLIYGEVQLATSRLTLPHPRLARRLFVLKPLAELAPGLVIPGIGLKVEELLHDLRGREENN